MPLIHECVVTTLTQDSKPHIAPLGLIEDGENWIIAPFRPSTTLTNLYSCNNVTASFTDNALSVKLAVTLLHEYRFVNVVEGRNGAIIQFSPSSIKPSGAM